MGSYSLLGTVYSFSMFDAIKKSNFDCSRLGLFHYALIAHDSPGDSFGGIARTIPGQDFIVTQGSSTSDDNVAAAFMHELGHDLGLYHGGSESGENYRPNYFSIMNYNYAYGLTSVSNQVTLDYSNGNLPTLNENDLDENTGLVGGSFLFNYWCSGILGSTRTQKWAAMNNPVDWNCSGGSPSGHVGADINRSLLNWRSELKDHDDWSALQLKGGTIGHPGAYIPLPAEVVVDDPLPLALDRMDLLGTLPKGSAGQPLVSFSVAVRDIKGIVAIADNSTQITVAKVSGPGAVTCPTATVSAGVATFSNCVASAVGQYELQATSSPALAPIKIGPVCVQNPLAGGTVPKYVSAGAAGSQSGQVSASVAWCDLSTDETGFRLLRSGGGAGGWTQVGPDLPPNTTSYTDTTVLPGTYYAYWVVALKDAQLFYAPTYMTVITPLAPARPVPIAAAAVATTQVRVQWADNSPDEDGFRVLRYLGGSWVNVSGDLAPGTTAFIDGNNGAFPLAPGQTYAYWVVAYKGATAAGLTYAPAYIAASTPVAVATNAPAFVSGSSTAATATVQWSAAGGAAASDGYEVLRQGPGGWTSVSGVLPPGTLSFTDTGLTPGTYYGYWVYGLSGGVRTYAGSYITVITGMPAPPIAVSAAGVPGGVHLTWADVSNNEDGFEVRRYNGSAWVVVGSVGPGVTSFTDTSGLVAGATYAYWLTSKLGPITSYAGGYIAATAY